MHGLQLAIGSQMFRKQGRVDMVSSICSSPLEKLEIYPRDRFPLKPTGGNKCF